MSQPVAKEHVQGNVLYAYGVRFPVAEHRFYRVPDGGTRAAVELLGRWIERVTFGKRDDPQPRVNLAFTFEGLRALSVADGLLEQFPEDFRTGAVGRSPRVGDRGRNVPARWEDGLGTSHLLLSVHAASRRDCSAAIEELTEMAAGILTPAGEPQVAGLLETGRGSPDDSCGVQFSREHFGFADGCSQPAIEGVDTRPEGDGVYARVPRGKIAGILQDVGVLREKRKWRPIRTGEFLLGYDSEDGRPPQVPDEPLGRNGTFMVFRKLAQDVAGFRELMRRWAGSQSAVADADAGAKVVGRTADGVPLARRRPEADRDRLAANDFIYGHDPWGHGCPLGAHVRRSNPRDALPGRGEVTMRHRIIRRGMPYGPAYDSDPAADRGLLFICLMASIQNGFEFIQRSWCNDGEVFGLGAEQDLLLHQAGAGPMTVQRENGEPLLLAPPPEPLVTVRGCEYLFVPGRHACAWLADPARL